MVDAVNSVDKHVSTLGGTKYRQKAIAAPGEVQLGGRFGCEFGC